MVFENVHDGRNLSFNKANKRKKYATLTGASGNNWRSLRRRYRELIARIGLEKWRRTCKSFASIQEKLHQPTHAIAGEE